MRRIIKGTMRFKLINSRTYWTEMLISKSLNKRRPNKVKVMGLRTTLVHLK